MRSHKKQAKWRYATPNELPTEIYRDQGQVMKNINETEKFKRIKDYLMRVIMLFFMDDKFSNYKIDPDNQMYFLDITGLRVVIKNCKLFRDQPQWHEWQKDFGISINFKKI